MLVTKRAQILELTSEKPLAPHHFLGASTRNVMRVGRQGARVLGYKWLQCLPPLPLELLAIGPVSLLRLLIVPGPVASDRSTRCLEILLLHRILPESCWVYLD